MKRVAFAWVTEWVDFTKITEAIDYAKAERAKGHRIVNYLNEYAYTEYEIVEAIYENGNDEYKWTVRVEKPYKKYNMG